MWYFAWAPAIGLAVLLTILAFMFWAAIALVPLLLAARSCARRLTNGNVTAEFVRAND